MKFRIINHSPVTRRELFRSVVKWVLYALMLVLSYAFQLTMPFADWQPFAVITLAVAVSFFESELCGVVFAAFAGMMQDLAMGSLFGFTSIWLMPCCLFVTLLTVNLIHRNIVNYLWMNIAVIIIVEAAELLFKYIIWRNPDIDIVLVNYILPAVIASVVISVPTYYLVRLINKKTNITNSLDNILSSLKDADEGDEDIRS